MIKNKSFIKLSILIIFSLCQVNLLNLLGQEELSFKQKYSYLLGRDTFEQAQRSGIELDLEIFIKAMHDAQKQEKSIIKPKEARKIMAELEKKLQQKEIKMKQKLAKKYKKLGEEFLEVNAKKKGVKSLANGMQYKIIKEGTGKSPISSDLVKCHYEGKLISGEIFDSSYKHGKPMTFPLNRVIKGWTEGLQHMKEGAKYEFYIPSNLAYGDNGSPPVIPPGALLIFVVELLEVNPSD